MTSARRWWGRKMAVASAGVLLAVVVGTLTAPARADVTAKAPLAEVTTYARTLSSMTGGQGSFTMEFSHYDVVPGNVQQDIMSKAKLKEEED